jgi:chromosome segregation ATPase
MDAERFSERLQQDLQNKTNELEKLQSEKSYLAFELRSLHHKVKDFARQNERLKKVSVMASLASTKDSLFSTYWNQLEVKVTSFEKSLTQEKNALLLQLAEEQKLSQAVLKASQEKYTLSQEELRKTRSQMRTMELDHNEKERTLKREHDAELKLQKDRIEGEYEAISVEKDVLQERVAKLENELGNGTLIPRVEGSENLEANKLQEKIDSLQKEQIEKMSTISRQKVEIQNLTTQVGQLKTTISEMTTKMSELEKELLQLKDNQDVQQENKQEWEQKKNEELESLRVELNLVREKEISKLRLELEEAHANQIARVRSEIAIKKDREARESEDKILTSWEVEREHWEKQVTEMRKQIRDKEESDRQFQTKINQLETNLAEANEKWIKSETDRAVDQKAYEKMLSAARHHVAASSGKTSTKKLIKKKTTPTAEARLSSMPRVVPHAQNAPVQITRPPQEKMKRLASVRNVLHRLNPNADKEEKPQVHTPEPTLDLQKPTSDKNENVRRALAKEGYLTKEGDKFKTWHRRFFRIAQEDNSYYLQYYETIDARKPIKQIDLGGAFVSLAPEKENGTNRLFCFKLRAVGRLLYLNASSRADREEWTKYLSVIIEEATLTSPNSKQGTPLE